MAYPDGVLRRGEHVLAHRRPHWRMLVVPALVPPAAVFLAALLAGLADGIPSSSTRTAVRLALVLLAAVAIGWLAVLPLVRWRCTHLVVTDRRLLVREGVLARESVEVAGATITEVRTRSTGSERVLGAGTLVVATAGTEEPWEFAGLGDVERLASLVETMAEDRGGLDQVAVPRAGAGGAWDELPAADELDDELDDEDPDALDAGDPGEPDEQDEPVRGWRGRRARRRERRRAARTSR
ncbi:PH domain-containing protein [Actinomycetospora straminea]|uniref:PH domain-containing protein n=1 Tax=Actinomycetospora straminea TaxID=663607 RepID=UPI002366D81D|nr:PH domain-containing protein [Actinomycetospora straminea]MDD7935585.1 PH domain-containing protein [Actinomycetospora straminea]